jgi:glycosyltransferase involved in cell wall biosynthesis
MPRVSVVIPSYNSAEYVPTALDSVLAQTFDDLEVLVVDDGSTDDTRERLAGYRSDPRFRYVHQANAGVACARNLGIAQSQGHYVAFLDADDTWYPNKLEQQINTIGGRPEHRACFTAFRRVDQNLAPISEIRSERGNVTLDDLLLRGNAIGSICTVVVERSLFEEAGGFDPELSQCADWDMWVRLAALTTFLYLDEPLVTYRQHNTNMSHNPALLERDSLRVLQKAFAMEQLPLHLRAMRRRALARNDVVLAGCYLHAGRYRDVLRCLKRAALLDFRECRYAAGYPLRALSRRLARRTASSLTN